MRVTVKLRLCHLVLDVSRHSSARTETYTNLFRVYGPLSTVFFSQEHAHQSISAFTTDYDTAIQLAKREFAICFAVVTARLPLFGS